METSGATIFCRKLTIVSGFELDAVYLAVGGFVIIIALYKRELLCEPSSFKIILGISIMVSLVGAVLTFTRSHENIMADALFGPPFSAGLFWAMRKLFIRRFQREPRDTFLNWQGGMAADRLFNVVYFPLATIGIILVPAGIRALANTVL